MQKAGVAKIRAKGSWAASAPATDWRYPEADVLLAGLSFVDAPDQVKWDHPWGDSVKVGPEHRIAAEAALLRRWRDEGRVRMLPMTETA